MVDVSQKDDTHRKAIAKGTIRMSAQTFDVLNQNKAPKGDVLGVARVAGIMAAKKTSEVIPLCHPLPLTRVAIDFEESLAKAEITCIATVETVGKTGVEMEALFAVQTTLLTIYDMLKATDKGMVISNVHLEHKSGGKSGVWQKT